MRTLTIIQPDSATLKAFRGSVVASVVLGIKECGAIHVPITFIGKVDAGILCRTMTIICATVGRRAKLLNSAEMNVSGSFPF